MRYAIALLLVLCAFPVAGQERQNQGTVLTGIVDQRGEEFVLSGEDAMQTQAVLRAAGFSPDNFARFVGERTEVRGELKTEGERRVLVVKRIEDLKKLPKTAR